MITRGSKFFYGGAAFAFLTAIVYGFVTGASDHGGVIAVFQEGALVDSIVGPLSFGWKGWVGDHIGYAILMGFAAVMAVTGVFHTAFRDGDAAALAQLAGTDEAPPIPVPTGSNLWPIITAFGAGTLVVGIALSSVLFVVGVVILVVCAFEWTVRAWSERSTSDSDLATDLRGHLMLPVEVPVIAVLAAGLVIFCLSRILLALPEQAATVIIIVLAAAIFGIAFLLASRPQLKRSVTVSVLLVVGLLLIGGGIAGGIAGARDLEEHDSGNESSLVINHTVGAASPVDVADH
jgi:hypothetical protein